MCVLHSDFYLYSLFFNFALTLGFRRLKAETNQPHLEVNVSIRRVNIASTKIPRMNLFYCPRVPREHTCWTAVRVRKTDIFINAQGNLQLILRTIYMTACEVKGKCIFVQRE